MSTSEPIRVVVTGSIFKSGITFGKMDDGQDVSITRAVVRRDYKYGSLLKYGWVLYCDMESRPEWKRPRVTRIHRIEM